MDWFKIGNGVYQGCVLSSCLFNLYAEYIMWNARLDESQSGIKTARRNINNLRYADDTNSMAESKEERKSIFKKVKKENEKAGLKLIQKTKIMAPGSIISWQIEGEKVETVTDFIFLGSKITVYGNNNHEIKICLLLRGKSYDKLRQHIKKQRHHFTIKGPYNQSFSFSSSQVWMWELDHKEN